MWDASPVGRSSAKSEYRSYIGWGITSVGIAFQRPDDFVRKVLLIIRDSTNIYESGARTPPQEVPTMTESPRDGVQSWTESMSARDRIRAVAESLREPRSVNWISEQADAAWSTTNEELQDLVDQGQLRRVEAGETTRYQPDYTRLLFEEIRTLIEENTREELRSELTAITEEIEEWQATYDVETWEDLEQSLADGDLASADLHERRDVITRWEVNLEDRRLIKHALALYSDVEAAREQMIDVADRATS
jgi:predicted transcriptional regulator